MSISYGDDSLPQNLHPIMWLISVGNNTSQSLCRMNWVWPCYQFHFKNHDFFWLRLLKCEFDMSIYLSLLPLNFKVLQGWQTEPFKWSLVSKSEIAQKCSLIVNPCGAFNERKIKLHFIKPLTLVWGGLINYWSQCYLY